MSYTVSFKGWGEGMDNIHAEHEVAQGSFRRGLNVDVMDSSKIRRRSGYTLTTASTGAHSLWNDKDGNGYYVDNTQLKKLDTVLAATVLTTVVNPRDRLVFEQVNGEIYFNSSSMQGKIVNGAVTEWGVEYPVVPPVAANAVGTLDAGSYAICVTYVDNTGRESAASPETTVTVTTGGVSLTGIPIPTSANVVSKNIYMTTANGEELYLATSLPTANTTWTLGTTPTGHLCRTQYKMRTPLGTALAQLNGRMFVVVGDTVWFTEAMNYDLVDLRSGFYMFPAPVSVICAVTDGLFVCADKTYFIRRAGEIEAAQEVVYDFGAFSGTLAPVPGSTKFMWMSERGAVVADDGGKTEILAEDRLNPGVLSDTAAFVREQDSIRQYVVVGQRVSDNPLVASTFMDAEIIRRAA